MAAARFPANPLSLVRTVAVQRELVFELVRGDIAGRYRGSVLGLLWSLASPLLLLGAFTFVFGTIFQSRWGSGAVGHGEYALLLFPGILLHGLMAEAVTRAPGLVTAVPNYVKKVVFPLELLPLVAVAVALFHALIAFVVLVAALVIVHGGLPVTALALPLILLPYVLLILGVTWILAALGVYLRDISQIMGLVTMLLMFLSPVLYPASALPQPYRTWLWLNPLTLPLEETRGALIEGRWPEWGALAIYCDRRRRRRVCGLLVVPEDAQGICRRRLDGVARGERSDAFRRRRVPLDEHDQREQQALALNARGEVRVDDGDEFGGVDAGNRVRREVGRGPATRVQPVADPGAHRQHEPLLAPRVNPFRQPALRNPSQGNLALAAAHPLGGRQRERRGDQIGLQERRAAFEAHRHGHPVIFDEKVVGEPRREVCGGRALQRVVRAGEPAQERRLPRVDVRRCAGHEPRAARRVGQQRKSRRCHRRRIVDEMGDRRRIVRAERALHVGDDPGIRRERRVVAVAREHLVGAFSGQHDGRMLSRFAREPVDGQQRLVADRFVERRGDVGQQRGEARLVEAEMMMTAARSPSRARARYSLSSCSADAKPIENVSTPGRCRAAIGGDDRAVETARQEHADRHVGDEPRRHRVLDEGASASSASGVAAPSVGT